MARIWLSLVALVVVSSAIAQRPPQTLPVTGIVLDPSGAYTPDATVTLKQGSNSVRAQGKTDSTGKFRFDAVASGNYSVEVQLEGFKKSITPVKVPSASSASLTITLALEGISSEVSVSGDESIQS